MYGAGWPRSRSREQRDRVERAVEREPAGEVHLVALAGAEAAPAIASHTVLVVVAVEARAPRDRCGGRRSAPCGSGGSRVAAPVRAVGAPGAVALDGDRRRRRRIARERVEAGEQRRPGPSAGSSDADARTAPARARGRARTRTTRPTSPGRRGVERGRAASAPRAHDHARRARPRPRCASPSRTTRPPGARPGSAASSVGGDERRRGASAHGTGVGPRRDAGFGATRNFDATVGTMAAPWLSSLGLAPRPLRPLRLAVVLCAAVTARRLVVLRQPLHRRRGREDPARRRSPPRRPSAENGRTSSSSAPTPRLRAEPARHQAFSDTDTQDGPPRSDTMMVLHADRRRSSFAVSFPVTSGSTSRAGARPRSTRRSTTVPQTVIDTLQADFNVDHQPLPRGRLRDLRGDRERDRQVPVYFPYVGRDSFTGLTHVCGAGCYQLDGARRARVRARPRYLEYQARTARRTATRARARRTSTASSASRTSCKKLGRIAVERALRRPDDRARPRRRADPEPPRRHDVRPPGVQRARPRLPRTRRRATRGPSSRRCRGSAATRTVVGAARSSSPTPTRCSPSSRARRRCPPRPPRPPPPRHRGPTPAAVRPVDVRVLVLNGSGVQGAAARRPRR